MVISVTAFGQIPSQLNMVFYRCGTDTCEREYNTLPVNTQAKREK